MWCKHYLHDFSSSLPHDGIKMELRRNVQTGLAELAGHSLLWWASLVAEMVKNLPAVQETWVLSLGEEDPLEKGMAIHSSILVWKILWTEEPGGLQSMGSHSDGQDWATDNSTSFSSLAHICSPTCISCQAWSLSFGFTHRTISPWVRIFTISTWERLGSGTLAAVLAPWKSSPWATKHNKTIHECAVGATYEQQDTKKQKIPTSTSKVVVVQSLSHVQLFETPWTAACQASLSITNSQSLLKLMSIESVMPSNHLILCHPLLSSIFPSIRIFSNESVLCIPCPWVFQPRGCQVSASMFLPNQCGPSSGSSKSEPFLSQIPPVTR